MQCLGATACVLVVLVLLGCGSADDHARPLVVSAASSLTAPVRSCAPPGTRLQFGGSDQLAAQVRQGVRPDVLAAADDAVTAQLHREGLLERPVVFAVNELVVAVPTDQDRIRRLADLARPGITVVLGAPGVPVGRYTRAVLRRLDPEQERRILANVRSEEPDVRGVVGKLLQGAADAGFVYRTDVTAAGGRLRAVPVPGRLLPSVQYGAGVLRGARSPDAARRFVDGLRSGSCARALGRAGFARPQGRSD